MHQYSHADGNYLPFFGITYINRVNLPSALDSKSANITIPIVFPFGSTRNATSLSVSSQTLPS